MFFFATIKSKKEFCSYEVDNNLFTNYAAFNLFLREKTCFSLLA